MKRPKYDPLDSALSALAAESVEEPERKPRRSASTPSDVSGPVVDPTSSSSAVPSSARTKRTTSRVQMNLNVDQSTRDRLHEAWTTNAAEYTKGEFLDELVRRYASVVAEELHGKSQ